MKKTLLLSVVLLSVCALSAQTWTFNQAPGVFTGGTGSDAIMFDNTAKDSEKAISAFTVAWDLAAAGTLSNYSGLGFLYKNSGGTTKAGWRFYPTDGDGYVQVDGGDVTTLIYNCTLNEKISVKFSSKNDNALDAAEMVTGKPTDGLDKIVGNNIELDEAVSSSNKEDIKIASFTVKTAGTVALKAKTGYRIYSITKGTDSSVSNPLADVVYFNGSEILNTEGLNIQMYNALGKLVRTSNATSINVSDLQNGIYIVRAEGLKGALKISK